MAVQVNSGQIRVSLYRQALHSTATTRCTHQHRAQPQQQCPQMSANSKRPHAHANPPHAGGRACNLPAWHGGVHGEDGGISGESHTVHIYAHTPRHATGRVTAQPVWPKPISLLPPRRDIGVPSMRCWPHLQALPRAASPESKPAAGRDPGCTRPHSTTRQQCRPERKAPCNAPSTSAASSVAETQEGGAVRHAWFSTQQ